MRRTILAPLQAVTPQLSPDEHSPVSALSLFSDETWDFSTEMDDTTKPFCRRAIRWKFKLTQKRNSLAPEYASMLLALKQLAYLMLFGFPRMKPISVVDRIIMLKVFIRFLAERPSPIFQFQDVLEFHLKDYIHYLKMRPGRRGAIHTSVLCHHLAALNLMYDRQDQLSGYLSFRPTGGRAPSKITGYRYAEARENRTQPIPDRELKILIEAAVNYLQYRATIIFNCLEDFNRFAEAYTLNSLDRQLRSRICERDFFARREDLRSIVDLNNELIHLRSACFIIVAFSTCMRISEISDYRFPDIVTRFNKLKTRKPTRPSSNDLKEVKIQELRQIIESLQEKNLLLARANNQLDIRAIELERRCRELEEQNARFRQECLKIVPFVRS